MSLEPEPTEEEVATLKGRTIIITGGASGIGKALVGITHSCGANIVIADVNEAAGQELANELKERTIFVKTDVSKWDSVLELFQATQLAFGAVDVVYANAGTNAWDNLFEDETDEATGKLKAPTLKNTEINLHGVIYTAKAAAHYFAKQPEKKCQLILTGSAASIIDTPPLYLYCAAKHGVLGLMRGMRTQLNDKNFTINMIAPWMTVTPMLPQWIRDLWGNLPANDPAGVARGLLIPAVRPKINGATFWIAGNRAIEVEEQMHATQPQWLGKELSVQVDEGQTRMGIDYKLCVVDK